MRTHTLFGLGQRQRPKRGPQSRAHPEARPRPTAHTWLLGFAWQDAGLLLFALSFSQRQGRCPPARTGGGAEQRRAGPALEEAWLGLPLYRLQAGSGCRLLRLRAQQCARDAFFMLALCLGIKMHSHFIKGLVPPKLHLTSFIAA